MKSTGCGDKWYNFLHKYKDGICKGSKDGTKPNNLRLNNHILQFVDKHSNTASELQPVLIKKKLRGLSPRANYAVREISAFGEVSANFCG
jgi:hypothetical protein